MRLSRDSQTPRIFLNSMTCLNYTFGICAWPGRDELLYACVCVFLVSDDGGHEKHSKKELLGGKRKDKKDRKDRGYATLEGESSPDEDQETK